MADIVPAKWIEIELRSTRTGFASKTEVLAEDHGAFGLHNTFSDKDGEHGVFTLTHCRTGFAVAYSNERTSLLEALQKLRELPIDWDGIESIEQFKAGVSDELKRKCLEIRDGAAATPIEGAA